MDYQELIDIIKKELKKLLEENELMDEEIKITPANVKLDSSRIKDYPLLNRREVLLRAYFKNAIGEAFTADIREFNGCVKDIFLLNHNPSLIATLNAVMRYLNLIDKTEHCQNSEPEECAKKLCEYLIDNYGEDIKVGIIGYQPAMIKCLAETFKNVIATDLNFDNVGRIRYGVPIYHGDMNEYLIKNSDVVLATGSTAVNGTICEILKLVRNYNKDIIFYGTSIAGVAKILNLKRFCLLGK
ncbi:hypothetical protein J422_03623 [Methanocaldococcus villosus KIN24-T80]|uniref:Putative heavy-metal chelation domain-containing protein n=1 Tax=Methanocaldococcus villosus KIN24-T80 TaxID=1069083 RepID=N6VQN3_9EURY|nr:DUF364 domain-containing protein [Methanocaldococcus villosus]ENN96205.1 hypothetical protein J422_03623 [Methanocaldococcus villosus KIN24-T80]